MGRNRGGSVALRIALYHNHPPGGAAQSFAHIGAELGARHELDVFTLSSAEELQASARSVRCFPFEPRSPMRFGLYLNELRSLQDIGALHRVNQRVAAEIDGGAYDVVLVSACRFAQAPPLLQHLRTPSVYFCHEPPRRFIDAFCRPEAFERGAYKRARRLVHRPVHQFVERAWQRTDQRAVRSATAVLTNSRFTQGRIRGYYGVNATVTYLGVDCERFSDATYDGGYVLSVGAIERHKGYDFLVRALARVPRDRRPPLLIVGGSANEAVARDLAALASRCDVELAIRLRLSARELTEAYRRARAFVYSSRLEPFGLAVLEAMASSLPVVAVAEGGVLESVDDGVTGLLVARREDAFAGALDRVLTDTGEAVRLGRAARRRAQEAWTWDAAAARIEIELDRAVRMRSEGLPAAGRAASLTTP